MKAMYHLPDLGENITAGDVVGIMVEPGQMVELEQPLLELETDKAVVEVPAGFRGKVLELHVKEGENLSVGAAVLSYESVEDTPTSAAESPAEEKPPVAEVADADPPKPEAAPAAAPAPPEEVPAEPARKPLLSAGSGNTPVPASPTVRRLARELGVEIRQVPGSGPGGRISRNDVKSFVKQQLSQPAQTSGGGGGVLPAEALPDFSTFGEIERIPFSNVRRVTATQMAKSWLLAPRVTQEDKADITRLEALRAKLQRKLDKTDPDAPRITATAVLLKVLAQALHAFPQFNSSIDTERQEIIRKQYCHVGVAVDTERGLLVPVIRDADRKGIVEIARELGELSARARARKSSMDELQGACITLTNLGGIGGTFFTPIVNHPEVAILGVARASMQPVWNAEAGSFEPRFMLPLALSYDHRVIDGADGARFTRWICEALEEPLMLAL